MTEREGILRGKLAGADTGVTLADIGADGCVSSSLILRPHTLACS